MSEALEIPLRGKRGIGRVAIVDRDDYEELGGMKWFVTIDGYAARGDDLRTMLMHRRILRLPYGDPRCSDHINGDRLDNRRGNLRIVTRAQNGQNVHLGPYRGVTWDAREKRWRARVVLQGRRECFLGYFDDREEARAVVVAFRREHMPFSIEDAA